MAARDEKARRDLWGILESHSQRIGKEFSETSTLAQVEALEKKWLGPNGILVRLGRKTFLREARPSARNVFLSTLKQHTRNAARYAKIWIDP